MMGRKFGAKISHCNDFSILGVTSSWACAIPWEARAASQISRGASVISRGSYISDSVRGKKVIPNQNRLTLLVEVVSRSKVVQRSHQTERRR